MADRYEDQYRRDRGYRRDERGFMDRAGDEVRSWFGDDEAERRRQMDDRDRGSYRDRDASGFRDRDYGYGSGYSSGSRYGTGAVDYYGSQDRGQYGASDRNYSSSIYDRGSSGAGRGYGSGYGQGYGQGYGASGSGDRSSSYGDRSTSYGDRTGGYGDRLSGYGDRTSSATERGYDQSWSQRDERDRGAGWFTGRGPKGYQRSDTRINDDVCDRLCDSGEIDATDIEVQVANGEVTLSGSVSDRSQKRRAEDLIEQVSGVREVHNNLRVANADRAASPLGLGSTAGSSAASGTGSTSGSLSTSGTGGVTGEQPGNVLGVGGGAPDKASSAGAGRR